MKNLVKNNKEKIVDYFILLAFSIFTYSELMVNQLVNNYDGIWEGSFHIAGPWELSLGRWFWYYLSKLRFGIATDPVISIIALMLFVGGIMLFIDMMEVKSRLVGYAAGAAFICTPVVCISLSYRYMSPTFGTAFFLAVLAVWLAVKINKIWIAIPVGGLVLALSLGSYQAYLCVACVIVLAYFIKVLFSDEDIKKNLKKMIAPVCVIILGGLLYIIILKIHLSVNSVEMSDYMGADEYSFINTLKEFPNIFKGSYQIWSLLTKGEYYYFNRLTKFFIVYIAMAVLAVSLVYCIVTQLKKTTIKPECVIKPVCMVLAVALMPVAAFSIRFITTTAPLSLQMTGGFFMVLPTLACALPLSFDGKRFEKIICGIVVVFLMIFSYGGFYQVQADQSAMYEGRISTESITDAIIDKIIDLDYLSPDYKYCFYGDAGGSPLYTVDYSTDKANAYARFGFWWGDYNAEKSWMGVVHDIEGMNLTFVTEEEYNDLRCTNEVINMPIFPYEGSIVLINDTVVIKVSE